MKKHLTITYRGAAVTGGSLAMIGIGFFTQNAISILLGCSLLGLIFFAGLITKLSLNKVTVDIHFPLRLSAINPFDVEVTLFNNHRFFDEINTKLLLTFPTFTQLKLHAPWTAAGTSSQIIKQLIIPRRVHSNKILGSLSTTFPFGFFKQQYDIIIEKPFIVTPRKITPVELTNQGSHQNYAAYSGITIGQTTGEPRGIRPWHTGDLARGIYWPASARSFTRGQGLQVREYDPPGFQPSTCHIVFHSYATGGEMVVSGDFERAISLLTGCISYLFNHGITCHLTADFIYWREIECTSKKQMVKCLKTLAYINRSSGTEIHELEKSLQQIPNNHSVLIISDMTPDTWHQITKQHPNSFIIDIRQISYQQSLNLQTKSA